MGPGFDEKSRFFCCKGEEPLYFCCLFTDPGAGFSMYRCTRKVVVLGSDTEICVRTELGVAGACSEFLAIRWGGPPLFLAAWPLGRRYAWYLVPLDLKGIILNFNRCSVMLIFKFRILVTHVVPIKSRGVSISCPQHASFRPPKIMT